MENVRLKLTDLTLDPDNAKIHTDSQIAQIVESIKRYGFNDPIGVHGNNNLIVEGHGRYMALCRLAKENPEYEYVDCIRLDHLSDKERQEYALAHNSTNLATGLDDEKVQELLKNVCGDMEAFGLLIKVDETARVVEDGFIPAPPAKPRVKPGETWKLGNHTLICGDTTDPAVVDKIAGGGDLMR